MAMSKGAARVEGPRNRGLRALRLRCRLCLSPGVAATVYFLRLSSGALYVGCTEHLAQRLADHATGQGGRTTRLDPPMALLHQELFSTLAKARRREAQLKRWSRAKKEALIRNDHETLRHLSRSRVKT